MKIAKIGRVGFAQAAAGLLLAALVPNASASFILELDDLGAGMGMPPEVVITDNLAGDINPLVGVITFSGAINNFIVNVTTGISKPIIGPARIHLNSVNVSGGAGTLEIRLTDTDFNPTGASPFLLEIAGVTDGSVVAMAAADEANAEFGVGSGGVISTAALGPSVFASTIVGSIGASPSHSITTWVRLTHSTSGIQVTSFDAEVTITPEPGTLGLLGISLLGLGCASRKINGFLIGK